MVEDQSCPHTRLRVEPPNHMRCSRCGLLLRDYETPDDAIAAMRRMLGTEHKIKPKVDPWAHIEPYVGGGSSVAMSTSDDDWRNQPVAEDDL